MPEINVDFTRNIQTIEKVIDSLYNGTILTVAFEYSLTPHRISEMFLPSDINDAILLIDGKKLHVNKAFLSIHSDFFRALFSSNFKEGHMDEIPIKDITFDDFGLMMSTIYPKTVYPNDRTVEKLLELSDRFIIPAIIGHVEHHLIHISKMSNEKKLWMADAYQMPELMEECILEMDSIEKFKLMKTTPEFAKLSDSAKARILENIADFV